MREYLLILAVLAICCTSLVKPRIGLYGYIWFALMRPDDLAWCEGRYPFSMALALATLAGAIRFAPKIPELFRNPITRLMLLLQVPIGLSVLLPAGRFLAADRYSEYMRMILIVLLVPLVIETHDHVRELAIVMALSLGGLGLRFGLYGIAHGGVQYSEGMGNQYDNNTLGIAMAMAAPLCWQCAGLARRRWLRLLLLLMVCTAAATVIFSNSRGASLSLGVGLLYLLRRSNHKVLSLAAIALAIVPVIYMVQDQYFNRMKTIAGYKDEASAASRIEFAGAAIRMWEAYPLTGVGFGSRNYAVLNRKFLGRDEVHAAHNTYLQMLADSGCFAYLIYASLLFGTVVWLHSGAKTASGGPENAGRLALALEMPLLVFLVGGTFGSMQRYDFPYMLLSSAAALYTVERERNENGAEETDAGTAEPDLESCSITS